MRKIITCSLVAVGLVAVTPVMAQGVYVGPGGVGVNTGIHPHRDYYRDRDDRFRNRGYYEGRSTYDGRGHRYGRDD